MRSVFRTHAVGFSMAMLLGCEQPPPAPPPGHGDSPHIIYFELGSAELTPSAVARLQKAVAEVKGGGGIWTMSAHTDRSGNAALNMELSRRRLEVVRDYLSLAGVDLRRTSLNAHGETRPMVSPKDGAEEAADRRVEIWVAISYGRKGP